MHVYYTTNHKTSKEENLAKFTYNVGNKSMQFHILKLVGKILNSWFIENSQNCIRKY